jgi:16S rRNA (guanine527-N7)-methyltransferase
VAIRSTAALYFRPVDTATSARLRAGAASFGVELDARQLERFGQYDDLLARWNAKLNLTRIGGDQVVTKHFLDSLAVIPALGAPSSLLDVGSGAGFPGIPVAIACPGIAVTLLESTQKKVAFLEAVRRTLGLGFAVQEARFEALDPTPFDAVVSRATFEPAEWVRRAAAWVAPGGRLLVMLGRDRPALDAPPGFGAASLNPYELLDGSRAIVVFQRSA